MGTFDPAKASAEWDRPHPRPFDYDPPPRQRVRTGCDDLFEYGHATREFRASVAAKWRTLTPGQRRKLARDLTITFASRFCGLSARQLGEAFGLPHSRISEILQAQRSAFGDGPQEQP